MKDDQASSTAYTVLQGILYVHDTSPYRGLVDDEVVQVGKRILNASEEGRRRLAQLNSWLFKKTVSLRERLLLPGISLHYVLRKRHVENITRQVIANGVTQVVMLGAGFDTLPWRLHLSHPEVNFIEIDHPATQAQKAKALSDDKKDNLHFLSVDFAKQDLKTALGEFEHFDGGRKTLFICEGVMMYLQPKDVDILFDSIRELSGSGSEFVFSTLEPRGSAKNSVPGILYWHLKQLNEPIIWDVDSNNMAEFLKARRCELKSIAGRDEMVAQQLDGKLNQALHQGEYFVHCEFE